MEHTQVPVCRFADELQLASLECVLKVFMCLSLIVFIRDVIFASQPDATNTTEKNTGSRRKRRREIDWNLLESLQKFHWIMGYSSNFTKVDVFVDVSIQSVSEAEVELSRKFKLADDQRFVYGVKSYKFEFLNGTASFGPAYPLCFTDARGIPKHCTAGCSIDGRYIITSGHDSCKGTQYYYKRGEKKNLIGHCVFHSVTPENDIAIIDTKKRKLRNSFFGRKGVNIFTGDIRKPLKSVVGKVNVYVSGASNPVCGDLEATWNKERGGLGVKVATAGQARAFQKGDSGSLVIAKRKDGLREENAIGIVSGIGTYRFTGGGAMAHVLVLPIGPAIEEFRKTPAQTEDEKLPS